MDPNANLAEQASCSDPARLRELRQALLEWLIAKGFEPDWTKYPAAAEDFRSWQAENSVTVRFHPDLAMTNTERFTLALTEAYRDLFANDPEYAYSASKCTPEYLAKLMTHGLARGTANKDGAGIKRACREVGIKPTYQAIKAFLKEPQP